MQATGQRWVLLAAMALAMAGPPCGAAAFSFGFFTGGDEADETAAILDPLPYAVTLQTVGAAEDDALRPALAAASALVTRQDTPASGAAGLLAAAKGDYRRLLAALYNAGYYAGTINIRINGQEAAGLPLTLQLTQPVAVQILVDPGPPFRFGRTGFTNPPPPPTDPRDAVPTDARDAFRTGAPARAAVIDRAGAEAVRQWRELGHPTARVTGRTATADHTRRALDVTVALDPGPIARNGRPEIRGNTRMKEGFLRYIAEIPESAPFDPRFIDRAETRLRRLGVFQSVRVVEGEAVNADGALPLTIEVQDRRLRRIGVGATFSSVDGLGLEAFWLHRNLFGRAERLRFDAAISGIGDESAIDDYGYRLGVSYARPGVIQPDTTLTLGAEMRQDVFDTYRERAGTLRAGLERIVNENLILGAGVGFTLSEVEDAAGTETFEYVSADVGATYDIRDSDVDPTRGVFATARLEPFYELGFENPGLRANIEARSYRALDAEARFVLAGRARLGSVIGGPREEVPTGLLFFSGGGGSVRGFEFRSNGVDIDGETFGGRGLFELSGEVRSRITDSIGLVGFADAGWVSEGSWAFDDADPRVGLGAGLRYQTGVGPLRLDVAAPLDRRSGEPAVALYLGIGQAF